MTIASGRQKLVELENSIDFQQNVLDMGAERLRELNEKYEAVDKEYRELLRKKNDLVEEVATLLENIDIYSNM